MHSLTIVEQGVRLHIEGDQLAVMQGEQIVRRVRLAEIDQVLLFGAVELTSAATAALARRGVDVVWLARHGGFRARLCGRASRNVALRLAQYRRSIEPAFAARVAGAIVAGKIDHQRQILLRAQRRLQDEALAEVLGQMRLLTDRAPRETDVDVIRGVEGQAAALYFGVFGKLIQSTDLRFDGRNRRPPRDPVNACLSFGYVLLGTVVETELLRCGLDPMLGFLHLPDFGRPSLMLDLLEEFRPFVDGLTLRLINRRQLNVYDFERRTGETLDEILAEGDDPAEGATVDDIGAPPATPEPREPERSGPRRPGIYLADSGRKVFLAEFWGRLRDRLHYPPRDAAYELRDIVREQAYRLARVIEGKEDAYEAFVPQ